jgi:hypothetical protein
VDEQTTGWQTTSRTNVERHIVHHIAQIGARRQRQIGGDSSRADCVNDSTHWRSGKVRSRTVLDDRFIDALNASVIRNTKIAEIDRHPLNRKRSVSIRLTKHQAQIGLKIEQKIGYHTRDPRRIDRQNGGNGASRLSVAG